MPGVTIVQSNMCYNIKPVPFVIIPAGIVLFFVILYQFIKSDTFHYLEWIVGAVMVFVIFVFGLQTVSTQQYEVVIDDSVVFSDFKLKYEIIADNGLTYTVAERFPEEIEE